MSLNLDSLLKSLEADAQIEKTASTTDVKPAISAELASVLEKKASEDITKKAFAEGETLARELLAKMALDMGAGSAVNNINADNANMVSDDDSKVTPNATGGNVEGVLQSTVDKAIASGATTEDRVNHETQVNNVDPGGEPVNGEKQASTKEENMDKKASDSQLASYIMEKLAQEFSSTTTTPAAGVNTDGAPVANRIQTDNAVMTAQDDAKVVGVQPGGDGTVNALFESIVAKAKAEGGNTDDLINGPGHVQSMTTQGVDGTPTTPSGEAVEKAAAVSELCAAGMDFDVAVDLVKQAEEAILSEAWETEKRACFDKLIETGVDFDRAVALIKQAEEDLAKQAE